MKVKMQVWGSGESSFTSPKNGRVYNRARLMGVAFDPYDGSQQPVVADLAYDAEALSETPKKDGFYLLDCSEITTRNAMLSLTFVSLVPFEQSGKK